MGGNQQEHTVQDEQGPELGVVDKQQQESPLPAWPDDDDGAGGGKPLSSPPRGCSSGTHLTFSCRAVIDGMHRQAGDAQRGRTLKAVQPQEGGEDDRHERDWESRWFGAGVVFGFFAGPGEQRGRWRRRCPLRELREKNMIIADSKSICSKKARIVFGM